MEQFDAGRLPLSLASFFSFNVYFGMQIGNRCCHFHFFFVLYCCYCEKKSKKQKETFCMRLTVFSSKFVLCKLLLNISFVLSKIWYVFLFVFVQYQLQFMHVFKLLLFFLFLLQHYYLIFNSLIFKWCCANFWIFRVLYFSHFFFSFFGHTIYSRLI